MSMLAWVVPRAVRSVRTSQFREYWLLYNRAYYRLVSERLVAVGMLLGPHPSLLMLGIV